MRYPPVREFFLLGRALKSHGTGGQLRLLIEDRFKGYVNTGAYIFLDLDGSRIPYKVLEVDEGQHFVVTLEDVDGKEASDALSGKEIWIPLDQIKSHHQKSARHLPDKWEGYTLIDETTGHSFSILRTEEYPQQLMAIIHVNEKEVLVPLHDQLIHELDRKARVIRMEIPEGLLEL